MTEHQTRGAAIYGMCRLCIFDPHAAGTWREQVAACENTSCPLHPFRAMPRQVVDGKETVANLRVRLAATDGTAEAA